MNYLCGIMTALTFSLRRLTDSNQMTWIYHGRIPHLYFKFQGSGASGAITDAAVNWEPLH